MPSGLQEFDQAHRFVWGSENITLVTDLAPIVMCYTSAIRMQLWAFVTYYVWAFLLCCRLIVRGS